METDTRTEDTTQQEKTDVIGQINRKESSASDSVFLINSTNKEENKESILKGLVLNVPTSRKNSKTVYADADDMNTDSKFPQNLFSCIGGLNTNSSNTTKKLEIGEPTDFKVVQHIGIRDSDLMQKLSNLSQSSVSSTADLKSEVKPSESSNNLRNSVQPENLN